jgi:hypothetical protein
MRRDTPSPYDALQGDTGEHPIDALIARRFPLQHLRHRMRKARDRLLAVRRARQAWPALEELLNDYRSVREKACFDIGYGLGASMGRAEALRVLGGRRPVAGRPLATRLRELVEQADCSPASQLAAVLEAAWSLTFDLSSPGRDSK